MIEVKNLVKIFSDRVVLDHFNMTLKDGEILGLLGPNGCGKTTSINCILGLLKPDQGEITLAGENPLNLSEKVRRLIGIVPQEIAVMEELTVYENIDFFLSLYEKNPSTRKVLLEKAIDFVGLKSHEKVLPKKLSGGLRRRLNIACGIAHQPKIIILDEPTVAVDAQSRAFILEGIMKLREQGATILYTTHYLDEAELLCDRFVIMDNQTNLCQGTLEELIDQVAVKERIEVVGDLTEDGQAALAKLPHVIDCHYSERTLSLSFSKTGGNLARTLHVLDQTEVVYEDIRSKKPSLQDIYLELTGKELRE